MSSKMLYAVQPYKVGTKTGKSLAMIIPAGFARDNHIDTSTIFILKNEDNKIGKIILQRIKDIEDEKSVQPVEVGRHDQAVGIVTTQTPLGVNADYDL